MGHPTENKNVRICMLMANFWPPAGGGQQQLYRLSISLIKKGARVIVLMRSHNTKAHYSRIENVEIYAMPVIFDNLRIIPSFCYILFSLIWLIRNRKNYDIIHCHQAYSPATIGILAKFLLKKKVVVKITASNEYGEVQEMKRLPFFKIRKKFLEEVDKFILISPQVKKELLGIGMLEEKMVYIPNGIELRSECSFDAISKNTARKRLQLPYRQIVIFSGRLSREKSLDTLLHAWKEVNNKVTGAHLLFLGDGGNFRNVEEELRGLSRELGLDKTVHFMGRVDNVHDYLLASDVFVLPSISEGMSNALLEAMMSGLAVIASKIDANNNVIQDKINGLLFECKNSNQLSDFIVLLLNETELRRNLGREAKKSAIEKYSMDLVADKHLQLYNQLLH